jgi:hypothetical protein
MVLADAFAWPQVGKHRFRDNGKSGPGRNARDDGLVWGEFEDPVRNDILRSKPLPDALAVGAAISERDQRGWSKISRSRQLTHHAWRHENELLFEHRPGLEMRRAKRLRDKCGLNFEIYQALD